MKTAKITRRLGLLAAIAATCLAFGASSAIAAPEIATFTAGLSDYQAGGHPDASTSFSLATEAVGGPTACLIGPCIDVKGGAPKDVIVDLPKGVYGNPRGIPQCEEADLIQTNCAPSSQVGIAKLTLNLGGQVQQPLSPIFNLAPNRGEAARFGLRAAGVLNAFISASVRPDGEYAVRAASNNILSAAILFGADITLWGVPAESSHDPYRHCAGAAAAALGCSYPLDRKPLMVAPAECGVDGITTLSVDSWRNPGDFDVASSEPKQVSGCAEQTFHPEITLQPTTSQAASPTGLDVTLRSPQNLEDPDGLATPPLKKAVVTLPEGMSVNPSSANGLGACSMQELGISPEGKANASPVSCPDSAKIGTLTADTPVLEEGLTGSIYLAQQNDNPFKSLLALYLVVENKERGVLVKLPGKVEADPDTGQLTATFDDNPQLPVETLQMHFKSGSRAPLITPSSCGTYTTHSTLTSWGTDVPAAELSDSFQITSGPNGAPCLTGGFNPKLSAGTSNPIGGDFSPFALQVSREDGTQQLGSITARLPKGLTGKLAGIPYCPDAALGGVSGEEGTGAAQLASPSCPSASQIGTVSVGAGAGSNPFYVDTGKAYLAGPYKGSPLSVAFLTPAVAGPFDLGSVVVRAALQVDPTTAEITAVSDPLPTILHGIPLDLRDVRVNMDRPQFTLNPTSCDPMAIEATITGSGGAQAHPSSRFQVGSCERLAFKPSLKLSVKGGTKRGAYQKLRAELRAKPGEAGIGKVSVALPHSEFLAQEHIKTICTRVQYAAKACPKASIYGYARAWTPLLGQPLEGPVYLRSSSNPLPDLVASLDGQIHIDLAGRIDSKNGGIRNTFETVPDAPVSKFVLTMQGGKKSLLVNSRDLCKSTNRATVKMDGQNGKVNDFRPVLRNSCGKRGRKGRHG